MERKVTDIADLKLRDEGAGSFSGYASTFGNFDSVKERPVRGAFAPHLSDFLKDGFVALGHSWSALPIATPTLAREDDIGLYVEAEFHTTPEAQAARTVMKERAARGKSLKLSIGYEVLEDEYVEEGRLLKNIKLYEYSLVNVPANQAAIITGIKSGVGSTLGLNEHGDMAVSTMKAFVERVGERHEFRAKEGRVLSSANIAYLGELQTLIRQGDEMITKILAAAAPKASEDEVKQAFMQWLHLEAQLNGVK